MDEFLTVKELGLRIKMAKQTIYNLINKKIFIQGKHYLKPTPMKILFKWSEVLAWKEESTLQVVQEPKTTEPVVIKPEDGIGESISQVQSDQLNPIKAPISKIHI
ncbi:MAG: hypothetical protein ABSE95_13360 [Thermodesulfobacteriota bacterium]